MVCAYSSHLHLLTAARALVCSIVDRAFEGVEEGGKIYKADFVELACEVVEHIM